MKKKKAKRQRTEWKEREESEGSDKQRDERKGAMSQRAGTTTNHRHFNREAMQPATGDVITPRRYQSALLSYRSYQNDVLFCDAKERGRNNDSKGGFPTYATSHCHFQVASDNFLFAYPLSFCERVSMSSFLGRNMPLHSHCRHSFCM